jgi:hypothetical protein
MVVDVGSTTYEVFATALTATVVIASLTVYLSEMTSVTVIYKYETLRQIPHLYFE